MGQARSISDGSRELKFGRCTRNCLIPLLCGSFTLTGKVWRKKNAQAVLNWV